MTVLIALLLSLTPAANQACEITVTVPPAINISRQEIMGHMPGTVPSGSSYDRIEIVIYYFSEGIEKFVYNEQSMQESLHGGAIRALIKLKKDGMLRKALFIEAGGGNREDILKNFSLKAGEALADN